MDPTPTQRRPGLGRRYPAWLVSDTATNLSSALTSFALPMLALMITDSPAQAGLIGALGLVARIVTTAMGGVLADRRSRVGLMILGGLCGLVLTLGFTLLALGGALTFATLLITNLLLNARTGLFGPAGSAALKEVVDERAIGRAQAANQGRDAVIALSGAPLGGVLLGVGGWLVGAAMLVCQGLAACFALLLRHTDPAGTRETKPLPPAAIDDARTAPRPHHGSGVAELAEAFRWLWSRRDLRGALLVCTIVNLGFNLGITTVLYSLQQEGVPTATIGLVSMGAGAGMLFGALAAPALVSRVPAGLLTVAGLTLGTAAIAALPLQDGAFGASCCLAFGMVATPALNAGLMGYFMVATPAPLMGRANSLLDLFAMGAMPLAPLLAGLGLDLWGRTPTLLLAAALCLVSALLALFTRSLRGLPVESRWAAHAAANAGQGASADASAGATEATSPAHAVEP